MSEAVSAEAKPAIRHGYRLQWEPAQNANVLLYPEGLVKLNTSAGEILKRCDGNRSIAQIVEDLERTFDASGLGPDVVAFVSYAMERNWLELRE